ncbi:MAG: DUF4177 domain-containing protein [Pseudomonadota bacterium]
MPRFEYKVVPAPRKGVPGKGVRGKTAKYANALSTIMNELGAEGWDYVRADTLPFEERSGLTSRTVTYQNMLVFRRPLDESEEFLRTLENAKDRRVAPIEMIEKGMGTTHVTGVLKSDQTEPAAETESKPRNLAAE